MLSTLLNHITLSTSFCRRRATCPSCLTWVGTAYPLLTLLAISTPLPKQEAGNLSILFDVGGVLGGAVAGYLSGKRGPIPQRCCGVTGVRRHCMFGHASAGFDSTPAARIDRDSSSGRAWQINLLTIADCHPSASPAADVSGASALVSFGFVFSAIPFLYMYRVFGELSFAGERGSWVCAVGFTAWSDPSRASEATVLSFTCA